MISGATSEALAESVELTPAVVWLGTMARRVAVGLPDNVQERNALVLQFIRHIQRNAIKAAAQRCREQTEPGADVFAAKVTELLEEP